MHTIPELILARATHYVKRLECGLTGVLGHGDQGVVFVKAPLSTHGRFSHPTALKVLLHEADYSRERDVYLRLRERDIEFIGDCAVPTLIAYDDTLCAIEMDIVEEPCIIDFASAYLDVPEEYASDLLDLGRSKGAEIFGAAWPIVQALLTELTSHGIYLTDLSPGNIRIHDTRMIR